jgi:ribosomal protein S18 acetylase RimI-like enzyme
MCLVIHPDYQRRGLGKLLVSDGVRRAHALGLPVILTASPAGQFLYSALGFEVRDFPIMTSAKIQLPIMVCEPPAVTK